MITPLYSALVGPYLGHSEDLNTRQTLITWSKFSGEPPGWTEAGEPALGEEAEEHGLVQIEEEPMRSLPTTYRGDKDDEARLFTLVYSKRMRNYRHKQEVLTKYKEKSIHYADDLAVEEVIQRGCGIIVLNGFQDLAGQIPQQPHLNSEHILL